MIHRINVFLLSLFVALAPNFIFLQAANATTVAAEGWSVTKRIVNGATTIYDGAKNVVLNGKNYTSKGVATITPAATQVSKMIVRTGAVLAVDLAIKTLIGAVDYVMDPANNRVKYYVDPASNSPSPTDQYMWKYESSVTGVNSFRYPGVPASICQSVLSLWSGKTPWKYDKVSLSSSSTTSIVCYLSSTTTSYDGNSGVARVNNPAYDPNAQPNREEKYLPYDAVASQIISDAAAEKADGKAYVSSVADTALEDEQRQIVPATDVTQQLNNSQSIPTSGTGTGTVAPPTTVDPTTGQPVTPKPSDITLNFPEFCGWAPTVCQAAQAAIDFPKTFLEKFTKWDDWINRETKPYTADETKIDTEDKRTFDFSVFNENRFSVDDKCPAPEPHTFALAGQTVSFSFDLQPVCSILEMAKPALIAASYIYAAYIVIGASRG
ncbi:hypothetical protein IIQ44_17350 [Acinetobacter oleivorans]|uniref:virulence factor TspB C-terminal domain-related protein n=1 Tax=Acinetobacter oleivorans TaxID=1148157 RepID=UPI00178CEA12|nr:virulence factor TspB C-terminal domain-related protein [Acinetobacter oleivorans]MBE2173662.1 hypothetical protein [Acinetobacter oleivorans]